MPLPGPTSGQLKWAYRGVRKQWRRVPKPVRFASNFIPGLGGVKIGTQGYRMYRGGRALRSSRRMSEGKKRMLGYADTAKDVLFLTAGPAITGYGLQIYEKAPGLQSFRKLTKSRGGTNSKSSQQSGVRKWGKQSHPPWAPSRRLGRTKSGSTAKRGRRWSTSRASRPPYCPVHKSRHWCWFTRKNK